MKESPIIFNSEMVRAILDGSKTQTRRIIKLDYERGMKNPVVRGKGGSASYVGSGLASTLCPFGAVGNRLWVRETFQGPLFDAKHIDAYLRDPEPFENPEYCKYAADGGPRPEYFDADDNLRYGWRSSTSMPRWASRITLEITGVRVERLQNISEQDAWAEGFEGYDDDFTGGKNGYSEFCDSWLGIYGADSWKANPWVWVVEFKRLEAGQ